MSIAACSDSAVSLGLCVSQRMVTGSVEVLAAADAAADAALVAALVAADEAPGDVEAPPLEHAASTTLRTTTRTAQAP